jgi:hypothetical protein
MPASGHQDHTASPSALALFVKSASASTASRATFVTIAKRLFHRRGMGRACKGDLPDGESGIFFAEGLDRFFDLPVGRGKTR